MHVYAKPWVSGFESGLELGFICAAVRRDGPRGRKTWAFARRFGRERAARSPCSLRGRPSPQEQSTEVEEVVVTGIRASLQQSLEAKRNADAVVDVITAEDVGKFPDKNVAEALQRVPGVSIQREFGEGERVSIRGTHPTLNRTLLNGHAIATADWFILDQFKASRSFNYLMLPSEIVGKRRGLQEPAGRHRRRRHRRHGQRPHPQSARPAQLHRSPARSRRCGTRRPTRSIPPARRC